MEYFQEWRTADHAALAAERVVFAASMRFIDGVGLGPTEKDIEDAHRLRAAADDLFKIAMQEVAEISEILRCR
jgi:hypothetical protein